MSAIVHMNKIMCTALLCIGFKNGIEAHNGVFTVNVHEMITLHIVNWPGEL